MVFIIEHLDPELSDWSLAEYKHIAKMLGRDGVLVTNIKADDAKKLERFAPCNPMRTKDLQIKKGIILDPNATVRLSQEDAKYENFIFGGILGNNPAEGRTKLLTQTLDFPTRNLGPKQFSTDTAAYVTKKLLEGKKLEEIRFVEEVEIQVDEGESFILPFPYVVEDGKLILSEDVVMHLQNRVGF